MRRDVWGAGKGGVLLLGGSSGGSAWLLHTWGAMEVIKQVGKHQEQRGRRDVLLWDCQAPFAPAW